jgi:hypothetical protein
MKGIVYTELLEFVERQMSLRMVDELCQLEGLSSNGVYTAVGSYPDKDIYIMLQHLTQQSGIAIPDLLRAFGKHLFTSLSQSYSSLIIDYTNTFSLVENLDKFIHPSVKKLYPDAQLPGFKTLEKSDKQMKVLYESHRGMHDLALGLLEQCSEHFNESIEISMHPLTESKAVEFVLQKK